MNVLNRILKLREEKGWSEYKLSVESEIPQSTISSWYRKNAQPSVASIEALCKAFGITMSEFFREDNTSCIYPSEIQIRLFEAFSHLETEKQEKLIEFLESFGK